MIKKVITLSLLALLSNNVYSYDLPKIGNDKSSASSGNIETDVGEFIKKSSDLADIANKSLVAINSAFSTEEQIAAKKAELAKIDGITDPKEKQAAQAKLNKSESAEAEKNLKSADAAEKIKSLSAEKQKKVGKAIFNFGVAALQAPTLIDKGQKIVSGASIANALKIVPVKDAIPLLQRFISDGAGTVAGFAKLAKGANIAVPEVTSSSQADSNIEI